MPADYSFYFFLFNLSDSRRQSGNYFFLEERSEMKKRKHHNNKGTRQVKNGKTREFIKHLAKKYGIEYKEKKQ